MELWTTCITVRDSCYVEIWAFSKQIEQRGNNPAILFIYYVRTHVCSIERRTGSNEQKNMYSTCLSGNESTQQSARPVSVSQGQPRGQHDVDLYPGRRKVLERLVIPLLPPPFVLLGGRRRRRLGHGGAEELPRAGTAAARDVALGGQHAGAVPAQQLRQQQRDGRHGTKTKTSSEQAAAPPMDRSHEWDRTEQASRDAPDGRNGTLVGGCVLELVRRGTATMVRVGGGRFIYMQSCVAAGRTRNRMKADRGAGVRWLRTALGLTTKKQRAFTACSARSQQPGN
jgi:hypothetical protein